MRLVRTLRGLAPPSVELDALLALAACDNAPERRHLARRLHTLGI